MAVVIETSLGNVTVDLYTDARPRCCQNFLKLCKVKYYNFCLFHSVQQNLVAQTGDPTDSGKGGESIFCRLYGEQAQYFTAEHKPRIKHKKRGLISMVNNGEGCHGSQFFITLADNLDYLDGLHTVFGEITEGIELIDKLNEAYCDTDHRPFKDIRIYHTIIVDDPFPDPNGLNVPDRSPEISLEQYESGRIGTEDDLNMDADLPPEELEELNMEKEAQSNAKILEMIGDLPEADIKPPDNVLFVCKLNPVTKSEDLEIIFSRFGTILACDVVCDKKTNASLQYAFIEFESKVECENAYLKMENVLIDDRRIHVDFSQSVAKEWNKFRRGESSNDATAPPSGERFKLKSRNRHDQDKYDMIFDDDAPSRDRHKHKHKSKDHIRHRSRSKSRDRHHRKSKRESPKRHSRSKEESSRHRRDRSPRHVRRRSRSRSREHRRRDDRR